MFRSRRAGLVRRLWRQRCVAAGPEDGPGALKPAAHALFKKLKDEELELLVQAVESRGAWESGCVWAPRGELRGAKQALPPQVLLCRLYRWPDLRQPHELKHLCYCAGGWGGCGDAAVLCCNPHHFSRLAVPGECRRLHRSPPLPTHPPTSGPQGSGGLQGDGTHIPAPHPLLFPPPETPPPPYSKASWPDEPQHPSTQLLEFSYNGGDWRGKRVPPGGGGQAGLAPLPQAALPPPHCRSGYGRAGHRAQKLGSRAGSHPRWEEKLRRGARGSCQGTSLGSAPPLRLLLFLAAPGSPPEEALPTGTHNVP